MNVDAPIEVGAAVRFADYTPADKELISISSTNNQTTYTDYPMNAAPLHQSVISSSAITAIILTALFIYVSGMTLVVQKIRVRQ